VSGAGGVRERVGDAVGNVGDGWQRFWFEPATPTTLALVRILYGITALFWTLSLLPDLMTYFSDGKGGLVREVASRGAGWSVFRFFPSDAAVWIAFVVLAVACVLLIIGLFPTPAAIVMWVLLVSFQHRNQYLLNSGDFVVRNMALLLALCPSGAALSVDRYRKVGRQRFWSPPAIPQWGLRLIQIQASFVYFFSFWNKTGMAWRGGSAATTAWRLTDLQRFAMPDFVLHNLWLSTVLSWGTLAVELILGILVWNRRWRLWALLGGLVLHLMIDATMLVGFFSWAMISALTSFLPPDVSDKWVDRGRRWLTSRRRNDAAAEPEPATS
jgi:hypothetical protein